MCDQNKTDRVIYPTLYQLQCLSEYKHVFRQTAVIVHTDYDLSRYRIVEYRIEYTDNVDVIRATAIAVVHGFNNLKSALLNADLRGYKYFYIVPRIFKFHTTWNIQNVISGLCEYTIYNELDEEVSNELCRKLQCKNEKQTGYEKINSTSTVAQRGCDCSGEIDCDKNRE